MRRRRRGRWGQVLAAAGAIVAAGGAWAADPDAAAALRFMRVHVPRDALADAPLGDDRYVPMPLGGFEAALMQAKAPAGPAAPPRGPRAEAARYEARIAPSGRLEGRVAFDVGATTAARGEVPLGALSVSQCTARTAAGVGAAVVFGRADGTLAVATTGAGEYVADWTAAAPWPTVDGPRYTLPLVPAVRATIRLQVPPGRRPVLVGQDLLPVRAGPDWSIDVAARPDVEFYLVDEDRPPPALAVWSAIEITGRQVGIDATVAPAAAWDRAEVVLEKDPALVVTAARLATVDHRGVSWSEAADGRSITCLLPPLVVGRRVPLVISAVGPLPDGTVRPLPSLRPPTPRWAGGGAVLRVDPTLALATIETPGCLAVTAEAAVAWPTPKPATDGVIPDAADRIVPAQVYLEQEGPGAEIRVAVAPRTPRLDVARVTIVDFAPGVVTGLATCDVGVERGAAFDLEGIVAPGWFIDAVDVVGWSRPTVWSDPGSPSDARHAEPLEWKVARDARGDVLRVGLGAAVTPGRRLRLRITGHRAGAADGAVFSVSEIDMVRLAGEADGRAALGFKTSAEQAVELDRADSGPIDPRLAPLVDDPGVRAWAPAGGRGAAGQVRLVRRRPPLDVQTQVRLTVRDDRLSESFTFECRPDTSALDTLVVRFSEPVDEQLEWALLAPASGAMVARRLESADESWLVEFTPPVREAVTIRAGRTVSFQGPVSVPLAWVDGAARQVGEVIIRDAGRRRPRMVNRRLRELPPTSGTADQWPALLGSFSFVGDDDSRGQPAAAELVPGSRDDTAARAWAWSETTVCWCYASGRTEFETAFEIESHGRSSLVLGLPAGREVRGIEIDGVPVVTVSREEVAAVPIDLPSGRSSFTLVVRSVAPLAVGRPWWQVEPAGMTIDLPVLDRRCRVCLPPELEISPVSSAWREIGRADGGVAGRLFGVEAPASRAVAAGAGVDAAFRERTFVPVAGRGEGGTIIVVRRRWIGVAAVAGGIFVACVTLVAARRRPWLVAVCCVITGVAALWCPAPVDVVARAAWWAAAGAALLTGRRRAAGAVPLAVAVLGLGPVPAASAADVLRVFITPSEEGETALVPEPLYRALARADAVENAAVRVVGCHVLVPAMRPDARRDAPWHVTIELDAAVAGVLALGPQEPTAAWLVDSARIDDAATRLTGGPERHDLVVATAGRHRLELDVRPRIEQRGDVEVLTVAIPPAPVATLEFAERADGGGSGGRGQRCEAAAAPESPFREAPGAWSADRGRFVHDVSVAGRVRLIRPLTDAVDIAAGPPVVESRNTVFWDLDACRLTAAFTVDSGRDIVAPCIVRADRGLALAGPPEPELDVVPLPGNRFLVQAAAPTAGPFRFELAFRMPLVDPVGSFRVPAAWVEHPAADVRTTRFMPASDLAVQVDVQAPLVSLVGEEGGPGAVAWRHELRDRDVPAAVGRRGAASTGRPSVEPRARIVVERRRQDIRGTQDIRVHFSADRTRIALEARLDASSTPLVSLPLEVPADCVIDSIALFDDALQPPDPTDRGPIEAQWLRGPAERGMLTVQRPRAGRFRLEVAAHLPKAPAATGRVPVVRALLPAVPGVVTWNEARGAAGLDRSWELRSDDRPPLYALRTVPVAEPPPPETEPPRAAQTEAAEPRVELAEVDLTFESRGRVWARARFDVVTQDRLLRLALPVGMRMFEVTVDGQPTATATPAPGGAPGPVAAGERWDVRLHDASWPRSIEVIYAGTVGGTPSEDGPVEITAPTLVGLPCVRRLWTLRAPRDTIVHVAAPGRVADAAAVGQARAATRAGLAGDFDRAIAAATAPDRDRLREGFAARARRFDEDEARIAAEAASVGAGSVVRVIGTAADASLTVRIAVRRDPTLVARAWATTAILGVGGVVWIAIRRRLSC